MAAVLNLRVGPNPAPLHDQCGAADPVDDALQLIVDHVRTLDPHVALARARRYKAAFAAVEMAAVADLTAATGSERAVKRALDDGKTSQKAIDRAAQRGAAAAKNTELIDKAATGELSEEQLDVIAETSAKTDGAAALDERFIDEIAAVNPDQARSIAASFVDDHKDPDRVASEHDRQRRERRASMYFSKKNGLDAITIAGDGIAIRKMWNLIAARSHQDYVADGGRDLSHRLHRRTQDQRNFDAAYELICGIPLERGNTDTSSTRSPAARPQVVVGFTIDNLLGADRKALATQVGLGLIPDSVLAEYIAVGDIVAALYDNQGEPLWLHRLKRNASLTQRLALIVRDRGCVMCSADHQHCDAHHLMPWNAPGRGETNLDQLALLCGPCHRRLHARNETLFRDEQRRWRTRRATAHETPPRRHRYRQRE